MRTACHHLEMSKHSASFIERMDEAAFWETYVATLLSRMGLYVLHHPTDIDPNGYEGHATSVDLTVAVNLDMGRMGSVLGGEEDVEVKSITRSLRPGRCTLCSQNSYLKKNGRDRTRHHFVFVERGTGQTYWLPAGSKVELGIDMFDSTRNETYKVACFQYEDLRSLHGLVALVKGGTDV